MDEMSSFLPQLEGMPVEQAWKTLFLVLVFVYLVLPFGWSGSPGRFGLLGTLPELCTQSVAPAAPHEAQVPPLR